MTALPPPKKTAWVLPERLSGPRLLRGAIAVAFLFGPVLGMQARSDSPLAPALPPQPGAAGASCRPTAALAGTPWTRALSEDWRSDSAPASAVAGRPFIVDPWVPCRVYRSPDGQHTLERSVDGGASWRTVFHDDVAALPDAVEKLAGPQNTFSISGIAIPQPGWVVVSESGNGDAVVKSTDAGRSWHLADRGLEGQSVLSLVFATQHPSVAYAVTAGTTVASGVRAEPGRAVVAGLYVSGDGGESWAPTAVVPGAPQVPGRSALLGPPQLRTDPLDPRHVWLLVGTGAAGITSLLESRDGGLTWVADGDLPFTPSQLLVTRPDPFSVRLLAVLPAQFSNATQQLIVSDDDGQSWAALPVQKDQLADPLLAADPADPARLLYTGLPQRGGAPSSLAAYWSSDGFRTWKTVPELRPLSGPSVPTGSFAGAVTPDTGIADPSSGLQADALGGVRVTLDERCGSGGCPGSDAQSSAGGTRTSVWLFTPAALLPPVSTPAAAPPGLVLPGSAPLPMATRATCPYSTTVLNTLGTKYTAGGDQVTAGATITFDGRDLLYTLGGETSTAAYQAVIHKLDPITCLDDGLILVDFDPGEYRTVELTLWSGQYRPPSIDTVAYDPNHNLIWASLGPIGSDASGNFEAYLFTINITDGGAGTLRPAHGRASPRFVLPSCYEQNGVSPLAYDWTNDTLLTCHLNAKQHPVNGRVDAADGRVLPSCLDGTLLGEDGWVIGAPGVLYSEDEEPNTTMWAYNAQTCAPQHLYVHRTVGETEAENDQITCDPITFGPQSAYAVAASVVWERDESASVVSAFQVPDSYCPFPTTTQYLGPFLAQRGDVVTMCAQLRQRGLGTLLGGLPLRFRLAGTDLGTATTRSDGIACIPVLVALEAGPHPVEVDFAGDSAYLASHGASTLLVTVPAPGQPAAAPLPPLPPRLGVDAPPPPQEPPPNLPAAEGPVPLPAHGTAPAPQAQYQPQPGSQAQAVPQAGVVAEKQTEVMPQLALAPQSVEQGQTSGDYAASLLAGGGSPEPLHAAGVMAAVVSAVAAAGVGIGRLMVRPAPEYAREVRRRRGHR